MEPLTLLAWVYGEPDRTAHFPALVIALGLFWAGSFVLRGVSLVERLAFGIYSLLMVWAGVVVVRYIIDVAARGSVAL